ncbi:MAG TPA: autotransporter-associated beta strand repeat-containing protein, partial [Opitutaceae bacterium]|nr:autotransporter-associated beta strand repeat-containing protein [Opitutaceae bacterium]
MSSAFDNNSNWSPAITNDTSTSLAVFGSAMLYPPSLASGFSVAGVQFASAVGTLTLSGPGTLAIGNAGIENLSTSGSPSISAPIVIGGTSATFTNQGALVLSGQVTNNATITLSGLGSEGAISGVITGAGSVTKDQTGRWTLSGANTYTGGTVVKLGTLVAAASGALPAGRAVSITPLASGSAELDVGDTLQTIGALTLGGGSGGSAILAVGTNGTLTVGGDITYNAASGPAGASISGGTVTWSGSRTFNIGDSSATSSSGDLSVWANITNAGDLVKTGSGKLVLSGNNTWGNTTISDGRLQIGSAGGFPSGGTVTISATNAGGSAIFDVGTQTVTVGTLTFKGAANSGNDVDLGPSGVLVLGGNVLYDGTNGPGPARIWNGNEVRIASGNRTITVNASGNVTNDAELTIETPITGAGGLTKAGSGTLALTANNSYTGGTTIDAGTLQIGNGYSYDSSVMGNITNNGTLTFATGYGLSYAGVISGTGAVNVTGYITLGGLNSYTGGTSVDSYGMLTIGNGGRVLGNIANNGMVVFDQTTDLNFSGIISGSGGIEQTGNSTLTLSGANTYSGETYVSEGTLKIGVANALPSDTRLSLTGTLDVAANQTLRDISAYGWSTLTVEPGATLTLAPTKQEMNFASAIGGGGKVVVNAPVFPVHYSGVNMLTGTLTVAAGTLNVSSTTGSLSDAGPLVIDASNGSRYATV